MTISHSIWSTVDFGVETLIIQAHIDWGDYGHGNLPPLPSFMPVFDEGFTTMCQRPYQYPLRFTICKLEKRGD